MIFGITAGQERYRALTKIFYKDANAAILVYDITRKDSFEELQTYWAEQIKEYAPPNIILAVVGNKSDLAAEEEVDEETARNYSEELGALFFPLLQKIELGLMNYFYKLQRNILGLMML